jgi:hypothetical protein
MDDPTDYESSDEEPRLSAEQEDAIAVRDYPFLAGYMFIFAAIIEVLSKGPFYKFTKYSWEMQEEFGCVLPTARSMKAIADFLKMQKITMIVSWCSGKPFVADTIAAMVGVPRVHQGSQGEGCLVITPSCNTDSGPGIAISGAIDKMIPWSFVVFTCEGPGDRYGDEHLWETLISHYDQLDLENSCLSWQGEYAAAVVYALKKLELKL